MNNKTDVIVILLGYKLQKYARIHRTDKASMANGLRAIKQVINTGEITKEERLQINEAFPYLVPNHMIDSDWIALVKRIIKVTERDKDQSFDIFHELFGIG